MAHFFVSPRVLPGHLASEQKGGVVDWGQNNLIAYGCQLVVIVVDPVAHQVIQTMDGHSASVTRIRWAPLPQDNRKIDEIHLASGDAMGTVVVWDVGEAVPFVRLREQGNTQPVVELRFHPQQTHLLASIHSPGTLILWNVDQEAKLWKRDYRLPLTVMHFDPFSPSEMMLAAQAKSNLYRLSGLSARDQSEEQFRVTSPSSGDDRIREMVPSPIHGIIFVLFEREVVIWSLQEKRVLSSIVIDIPQAPLVRLVVCNEHPDLLFCLHEDGTLTSWWSREQGAEYILQCTWDLVKAKKRLGLYVFGMAANPKNETSLVVLSQDGKLAHWQYYRPTEDSVDEEASFHLTWLLQNVASPVSSLSVSPFSVVGEALVAVGTEDGVIQVFDILTSSLVAEYLVLQDQDAVRARAREGGMGTAARGIEWLAFDRLILFGVINLGESSWQSFLPILDMQTGNVTHFRKRGEAESTFIRAIRLNKTHEYLCVLLHKKPFELWDMKSRTIIRRVATSSYCTQLEWLPNPNPEDKSWREQFVFMCINGSLHHYEIADRQVQTAGSFSHPDLGFGIITSMSTKGDLLVVADSIGTLHAWNYKERKSKGFVTGRGFVRKVLFEPGDSSRVLALFESHDYGIWDLSTGERISDSKLLRKERTFSAVDLTWAASNHPMIATEDGSVRIMDWRLYETNSPFHRRALKDTHGRDEGRPGAFMDLLGDLMQHGTMLETPRGMFQQRQDPTWVAWMSRMQGKEDSVQRGYLKKRSPSKMKGWQSRYFKVTSRYVLYTKSHKDESEGKRPSTIPLSAILEVKVVDKTKGLFNIVTRGREFELMADTMPEAIRWMEVLEAGRQAVQADV